MRMKTARNDSPTEGRSLWCAVTVAFLIVAQPAARAGFCAIGCSGPIPVSEDEPFARLDLRRGPDLSEADTVEYFTEDGSALAGLDYVARRGTTTFAIGQQTATVEVPLLDNGLLDGPRDFHLVVTRRGQFFDERWVVIQDNELRGVVDPLYAPERGATWGYRLAASMPADRILALDGSRLVTVLGLDGSVEHTFDPAPDRACIQVGSLHALPDGRILVGLYGCGEPGEPAQLLRFLPTGTLDFEYLVPGFGGVVAVQPDGKALVRTVGAQYALTLVRLNLDGSTDPGFLPYTGLETLDQVAAMDDGRILIGGNGKGDSGPRLVRLNPDGSPDRTFSFRTSSGRFLLRSDGRLIVGVSNPERIIQLDEGGGLDASFGLEPLSGYTEPPLPAFEEPDSRLLTSGTRYCSGPGFVAQWDVSGKLGWEVPFGGGLGTCGFPIPLFLTTTSGHVLMVGQFASVEGFPRRGLARLLPNPPEREFRVMIPATFRASMGVALVRVVRTGPTTLGGTVAFHTRDDTAVAGRDYVAQSGTLAFDPLEVSKEVRVLLLPGSGGDEGRTFGLALDQPSPGYAVVETSPVHILPDLRIVPESVRPRAESSSALTLRGTVPGRWYSLEASADLKTWEYLGGSVAAGNATTIEFPRASPSGRFFRAFGE